jgi:molecular chaperone IbpA
MNKKNLISPIAFEQFFDQVFSDLNTSFSKTEELFQDKKTYNNYPPSNIIESTKNNETSWIIELALAGWSKEDLSIEVEDDSLLIINGNKSVPFLNTNEINLIQKYIYNGIAERKFVKEYKFSESINTLNVTFINGILRVEIITKPTKKKIYSVNIKK